ncbi:MAG: DEAD/DEAH box helicase [Lachnospiraceae bacterium]|nr:DEAD/DEAH box helicase [Lachnospiraceae bacterium]
MLVNFRVEKADKDTIRALITVLESAEASREDILRIQKSNLDYLKMAYNKVRAMNFIGPGFRNDLLRGVPIAEPPEFLQLIRILGITERLEQAVFHCDRIISEYTEGLTKDAELLRSYSSGLKLLFASKTVKASLLEAGKRVEYSLNGEYGNTIMETLMQVRAISSQSVDEISLFRKDPEPYLKVLKRAMGIFYSESAPAEIKAVRDRLSYLECSKAQGRAAREKAAAAVKKAVDEKLLLQCRETMKDIPVEELSKEKAGIRVQLLESGGFRTLADVNRASVEGLSSVNGIGKQSAAHIKEVAAHYAEDLKKNTYLKLSGDDTSAEASKLMVAIRQYQLIRKAAVAVDQRENNYGSRVRAAVPVLQHMTDINQWYFITPAQRETVRNAYYDMTEVIRGPYGAEAEDILPLIRNGGQVTAADARSAYMLDPISFTQVVEEVYPSALGSDTDDHGLTEDLIRSIDQEDLQVDGLNCTLRRYQEWGVKYILHQKRVLLGDEMGLGKTVQAIAAMVSLKNTGATHFLVVCPASVISNWCREVTKHSQLAVTEIYGSDRDEELKLWISGGGVGVTNYETVGKLELAENFRFDFMVVDEAHYIKNPEASRSKNTMAVAAKADRLLFMTGTALENKPEEMIQLIHILQPDVGKQVSGMTALTKAPQFRQLVAPVYYRRRREEVLTELPEKFEKEQWCKLGKEEEKAYEAAVLDKKFTLSRRVSWMMEDLTKSCKAIRMKEIVEEAASDGRKIIVFSFFLDTIRKVQEFLGDRCYGPITGAVTPAKRQEILDEFDKAPQGSVLVSQIVSGGTGLNIQSASVVILCEPQFKPSIENQAISRAYRMGQSRSVLVHRLLCDDTVDERIMELLSAKQELFDSFANDSEAGKDSLSIDEASFGNIIQQEIDRIMEKNGSPS